MALRCLSWPKISPIDAASLDGKKIVVLRAIIEHSRMPNAALRRFAQDSSFAVLKKQFLNLFG